MSESNTSLKIVGVIIFIILTFFGVVYLLASPVDQSQTISRLTIGLLLIAIAITILVIILILAQRTKYKIIKVKGQKVEEGEKKEFIPSEMVCKNCGAPLEISEEMKMRDVVYCEKCGEEIKLPKDKVRW